MKPQIKRQARWLDQILTSGSYPRAGAKRPLDPRLHEYQRRAVQHLWDHPRSALFMEMGLGKTAVTLQALTPQHLPALVIGTKRVASRVWPAEIPKWRPDLSYALAAGAPAQRRKALDSGADVVIIGRDNLHDEIPDHFRTLVLDELTSFKSRQSKRWKAAAKLARQAQYVWGLTGTPAPNGYLDLWAQIYLLDFGFRLEPNITRYRSRYFDPGHTLPSGVVAKWTLKEGSREAIDQRLADICLSMQTADYLELPPRITNLVPVDIGPKAFKIHQKMKKDLVAEVDKMAYSAANAATASNRLSQITAGFMYPDQFELDPVTTQLHLAKIEAVQEIIEATGSPVLVAYRFIWERDTLLAKIPGAAHIDEPDVVDRWNRGEVPALVVHPASAGHGLNLQAGGHTIVWTSPTWSLEEDLQLNGRLDRQGQTKPVTVHYLVAPGTIDETILEVVGKKDQVQSALMRFLSDVA